MIPLVVVDITPQQADAARKEALIRACDQTIHRGHCELATSGRESAPLSAIAVVVWNADDELSVRLEVGVRETRDTRWTIRNLSFDPHDHPLERWRSAGMAIATLVGEIPAVESGSESDASRDPRPKTASPAAEKKHPATIRGQQSAHDGKPAARWLSLAMGGTFGPVAAEGPWRAGVSAGASWDLVPSWVFASTLGSYEVRPEGTGGVEAEWWTLGVGGGGALRLPARFELLGQAEIFAQRLKVQAVLAATGAEDESFAWSPGVRLTLGLAFPSDSRVSAIAGPQWWSLGAGTTIRVADLPAERFSPWGLGAYLGLRVRILPTE